MNETMKIFNLTQANLFIQHGCKVVGVGMGNKFKVYVLFQADDKFKSLLERWHKHEFDINK